ncbi:MAG: VWA domain-containing protein [Thermomicrobiales bacterium]
MTSTHGSGASTVLVTAQWEKPVVPASGGKTTLLVRITGTQIVGAAAPRRAPLDVAFVLDRSGSMSGEKLALVKEAVTEALGHLAVEDRAALISYDHRVETVHGLAPATSRAKATMRVALHGIDAGGSTCLSGGWFAGCGELSRDMEPRGRVRVRRAVLLTDGQANDGITDREELLGHAGQLRRRGIGTTTLGVGLDFDEELLAGMAEAGGGSFQFIRRPSELRAFFARELGDLLSVTAVGLTLSITMPEGVRARLINAFPHERTGKRIDVAVGDLAAGDEINLVFSVSARPGAIGAEHRVKVGAQWTDPTADVSRSIELTTAALRLADGREVESTVADPVVAEQAALRRAEETMREAVRLDRQGRHAESRQRLAGAVQHLAAAPMTAAVRSRQESMRHVAEMDAGVGLGEETLKQAVYESHRQSRGKRGPDGSA